MINIRVGELLEESRQNTKFLFDLGTQPQTLTKEQFSVEFECKFAKVEGVDYAAEAKLIHTSIQTLLKLSKGLNYLAKHIIEEMDVAASVKQVGDDHFLVLQLIVLDQSHVRNLQNIVEKLKHKEQTESIRVELQSNTVGVPLEEQLGSPGLFVQVKTELYQGTRESLKQVVEAAGDTEVISGFVKPVLYLLSMRKLTLEVDLATDLWELLPAGCPGILRKGLSKIEGNTKFPLTTSMKKIATIFKEKMVSDFKVSASIGSLHLTVSLRYKELFTNFLSSFLDV